MNAARPDAPPWLLWPLPLLAGLLPLVGTVVAFRLSSHLGLIESCNPFFDGCVSISRAARYELPNYLFRALLLPAAALQALTWLLARRWLQGDNGPDRLLRALPWIGLIAACFLVLYGSFLGTEGVAYRWMRRYGVVFYFGMTCIAMLVVSGRVQRGAITVVARWPSRALVWLAMSLPAMGVLTAFAPLFVEQPARDAFQNALEWWGGLIFTLFFLVLAWAWRRTRFAASFSMPSTPH